MIDVPLMCNKKSVLNAS